MGQVCAEVTAARFLWYIGVVAVGRAVDTRGGAGGQVMREIAEEVVAELLREGSQNNPVNPEAASMVAAGVREHEAQQGSQHMAQTNKVA